MANAPTRTRQVLFKLRGGLYALPVEQVTEMLLLPRVTPMPRAPEYVRGVINLRGRVLPVVDLRLRLGMGSNLEGVRGLVGKIQALVAEHRGQVEAWRAALEEGGEVPALPGEADCALGVWLEGFQARRSFHLTQAVKSLVRPHHDLHQALAEIAAAGQDPQATGQALAALARGELKELEARSQEVCRLVVETNREIAVCLENGGRPLAATVDEVVAVEDLMAERGEELALATGSEVGGLLSGLAKRGADQELVLLLDSRHLRGLVADLPA